jgi:ligand-binding sensor domain-containing protein
VAFGPVLFLVVLIIIPPKYSTFQKYFPDNSKNAVSGSAVREICEDNDGNLWIGTEDAGLNKLNPTTGAFTQFKPSGDQSNIAYTNIHGLQVDGNNLWIGTFEHGLDVMNVQTGKVIKHYAAGSGKNDLRSNFVVSMLRTKSGDIYIGSGNSLYKYLPEEDGFEQVAETPEHILLPVYWRITITIFGLERMAEAYIILTQ